jgi:Zn-dependent M32 family carboxypeptidase
MYTPIYDNSFKKNVLKTFGFDTEVERVETKRCPFCGMPVNDEDFRDELSRKEARISGICQLCQDEVFGS